MSLWRNLAVRVAIGVAGAVLIVIFDGVFDVGVEPSLALLAGTTVAAGSWAFTHLASAGATYEWRQPSWYTRSPHLQADVRTRRLASVLSNAQPGRGFEARGVARHLAFLTAGRLVTTGRISREAGDEDPLAGADPHLSASLLAYLRSADAEHPQVLNRKALRAHLKEIDSL
ncbi:MAG: hypothetical protein Q4P15_04885 [Propionibacteriaceae bacterium]|nr:hypothetical protein [Propionibacteriaceae bacterium]